mmetsp:Transcript_29237/g.48503  ORF Transcript_29237/g.48503 Transcript_29237/m.48503 type:complete len:316 (-) Transcript_29237:95-1042(-)|eukprot:CAMPEP_0119325338 /NCGR_PEP_ID=MMETSP1333-20130426/65553_1 /TAXON_ID=418940 /ORGANISM="Scyphosphaera apsteinii, Strain RCC1455" /LENGTH=315 /DNA_ID=CAMNT_0007333301 /DNA_START=234 /DNA_END=1181 /DNA_ORIENTATION=-
MAGPARAAVQLNQRFSEGRPDNHIAQAGVLIHWLLLPSALYRIGKQQPIAGQPFVDRIPCNLVNQRMSGHESGTLPVLNWWNLPVGLVISPKFAHIACSYPRDGFSHGHDCNSNNGSLAVVRASVGERDCIPGCYERDGTYWPQQLTEMLSRQEALKAQSNSPWHKWNEVIIKPRPVLENLAQGSVEAILAPTVCAAELQKCHPPVTSVLSELNDATRSKAAKLPPIVIFDQWNLTVPFHAAAPAQHRSANAIRANRHVQYHVMNRMCEVLNHSCSDLLGTVRAHHDSQCAYVQSDVRLQKLCWRFRVFRKMKAT